MATNPTLLCVHRDPARLRVLQENGYELLTAANGHEGLQLFRSRAVDAVVLEYSLGLLDGAVIASEIKQVRPNVPVVMVAEHAELPTGALHAVDALVSTSDPPHFVWAAVHFLLTVKPVQHRALRWSAQVGVLSRSRTGLMKTRDAVAQSATHDKDDPFPANVWEGILNGTVQF
jgi:CheY-like chemotaxis protein